MQTRNIKALIGFAALFLVMQGHCAMAQTRDANFAAINQQHPAKSTYFGNPRIESVRTSDWKYIRYFKNDRSHFASVTKKTLYEVSPKQVTSCAKWLSSSIRDEQPVYEELFQLASDPSKSVNLASRTCYNQKLQELRTECQRLVTYAKGDVNEPPATLVVDGIREGNKK